MKWFVGIFLLYIAHIKVAFGLLIPAFDHLPVQWQKAERWQWQGQEIFSQRFSSDHDVLTLSALIEQRLEAVDLRIQRLSSSWLLSFDDLPTHTHYLLLLSAQSKGTQGWLSTLTLAPKSPALNNLTPPSLFNGLYQHSWHLRIPSTEQEPLYFVLQPTSQSSTLWAQFKRRLMQHAWSGALCDQGQWCQWQKAAQRLTLWVDPKQGLWHVLWWSGSATPFASRGNE